VGQRLRLGDRQEAEDWDGGGDGERYALEFCPQHEPLTRGDLWYLDRFGVLRSAEGGLALDGSGEECSTSLSRSLSLSLSFSFFSLSLSFSFFSLSLSFSFFSLSLSFSIVLFLYRFLSLSFSIDLFLYRSLSLLLSVSPAVA
jgi:hypothetical protein